MNTESQGVRRDDRTGEYFLASPESDGKFPRETFIAAEFWIGNISGVAELREELRAITKRDDSLLQTKCLYSGSHSGDVIELALLPALEHEIDGLFDEHRPKLSEYFITFLRGMLELIQTAKKEQNPIVFV
jgi:hypothetical protein